MNKNKQSELLNMKNILSSASSKVLARELWNDLFKPEVIEPWNEPQIDNSVQEPASISIPISNTNTNSNEVKDVFEIKESRNKQDTFSESDNGEYFSNKDVKVMAINNDLYHKQMAKKLQKEQKWEELRKKKEKESLKELQDKPTINKKSKQLSKKIPPWYKRVNEVDEKAKAKLLKIQAELIKKQKDEIESTSIRSKCNENDFDFNDWIYRNEQWNIERKAKLIKLKEDIKEYEGENVTYNFKPEVNPKSERIVKKKGETFLQRQTHKENNTKDYMPSFRPTINNDYKVSSKYYNFMNEDQVVIYNALNHN